MRIGGKTPGDRRSYGIGAFDRGYVPLAPAWPKNRGQRKKLPDRGGKSANHLATVGVKCSTGCGASVKYRASGVCVNCERHLELVAAMKVVLEYETEWVVTGVVFKDEVYLKAKEFVSRWGGAL